ncbi:MAG: TlpA family protein disulfide reductase [Acidobacteria bacterium]|nr:TlpA family protein disulfide reductase [Acidobacteriota bacterium]
MTVKAFTDRQVAESLVALDTMLAGETDPAKWAPHAETVLWQFARYVQTRRLSASQEQRVLRKLDALAAARPGHARLVAGPRFMISSLTVGKTAPDIAGKDLDGVEFRLSDYRGRIVALVFSAEWCGICRSLFPYERLMLELYRQWPFALLGVETGSTAAAARQAKASESLNYRSWWDAPGPDGRGPIASTWNVGGYPAVYVIDGSGVIRFVDLRYEDLLKGVRQLLYEPTVVAKKQ